MSAQTLERWEGDLTAGDGTRLRVRRLAPARPRADVVFVHGYSEHSARHGALYEALTGAGLAVHALDLRGHGRSGGRRGHVPGFQSYLDDLETVRREGVGASGRPTFLVGHSLGGLIVLRALLARPEGIRAAAVSSPFLAPAFPISPLKRAFLGVGGRLAPALAAPNPMDVTRLTSDPALQAETLADPLYNRLVTPGWFRAVRRAQGEVRRGASRLRTPLLVMQAGADAIADPAATRALFEALPGPDKDWALFPGFQHELFREAGRQAPIDRVVAWFVRHLTP